MKAVIVECSNGAAVALCDDGTFKKLKNRDYSIGQELILQQKAPANRIVQKLSICASLALVLLSFAGIGSYSYVSPYSYVSLDINPSIEYALNRYDKVISVSGINDEGQRIVSSIESDVKNQNITTAIGVTIRQLEKDNYIVEQEYNHVIVSVCSDNDTKAKAIASRVDTFSTEEVQVCAIDTMTVSKEVKDSADSLGITPGKLALIHAVAETTSDSNFDMAEWTGMTVSELETTIQQASSQPSNPVTGPAAVSVINSEYLSNALDENAAQKEEEMTASTGEADTETGSTSTDQQTNNTADSNTNNGNLSGTGSAADDYTAADPNGSMANSTAKDDIDGAGNGNTSNTGMSADNTDNAANGNTSAGNDSSTGNGSNAAGNTNSAGNSSNTAGNTNGAGDSSNAAGNNNSTGNSSNTAGNTNNTGNSGNAAGNGSTSADNTNSTAGQDTSAKPSDKNGVTSGSDQKDGTDDLLTEDSSSKKDSYPLPDTEEMEDSANTEESAGAEDSAVNGEAQENTDISDALDSEVIGSDELPGQIKPAESDEWSEEITEGTLKSQKDSDEIPGHISE